MKFFAWSTTNPTLVFFLVYMMQPLLSNGRQIRILEKQKTRKQRQAEVGGQGHHILLASRARVALFLKVINQIIVLSNKESNALRHTCVTLAP